MTIIQIIFVIGFIIVAFKFVASIFGYGNIPVLNAVVTFILGSFVIFEIVKLVQAMIVSFG
ncbi:MAG: hypothetical protein F6K36_11770 [Symploca sp. SIO3C6]|uniref:Uncharacterized protein n=1 Tax=Symploca sp. SIO1C4 TaxID=2607765 RepID=A0A6B3NJ97_9CYAN|nr:hypothetical protein [Symploca sp. SIO3C6]NER30592.1 hypothetical protein [Symploca sp. SIO1C4]NET07621.1 hypothetical protein [Symploca sp. SIO2B6]